jgi:ribonuclease BN (tRNA processing enzyme)
MTTELVLLGTAGAPMPVAHRGGIASALVVDGRVFLIDCGRGAPSAYADAGLDFSRLEEVFLTHLHADHIGDLAGMLVYPWGGRSSEDGALAPIGVYGPSRPDGLPAGDATFMRETTIHPANPAPGTTDLVKSIITGYAYHLNVMPLDAAMPDPGALVQAIDIHIPAWTAGTPQVPVVVFDDGVVRVTTVAVTHGRAVPALAYRFDTPDGCVAFSGDTTVNEDLIDLARGADILVHQVADLGYLERHGCTGAARADGRLAHRCDPGRGSRRARAGGRAHPQSLPSGRAGRHHGHRVGRARRAGLQRKDDRGCRRDAQNAPADRWVITSGRCGVWLAGEHRRSLIETSRERR